MHDIPAIEFDDVTFGYGDGEPVLSGASLHVAEGEFVALAGNNGSGKSTVAALVDAFLAPSDGSVRIFGQDVASTMQEGEDAVLALRRNIGAVFQNPDDQLVASIVVDEVAFGPSNLGLSRNDVISRVEESLAAVGMLDNVGDDVNTLSGGQKQRIAIADALAMRPRILLLDEPTSMLDPQGKKDVLDIVQRLHDEGMTVLWITHFPDEAAAADRVVAIEDGRFVEHEGLPPAKPLLEPVSSKGPGHSAPVLIRMDDVSFSYDGQSERSLDVFGQPASKKVILTGIDLQIREGELLAIAGPNGSGKSTLTQLMNGLLKPTRGTVEVCGISTASKDGANSARLNVALCFQYPERSLFAQTVYDDIAFGPKSEGLSEPEVDERVRTAMDRLCLPMEKFAGRSPFELSGGEQRKVAIAGIIAMRPNVLVLDEPCASLDAPTHAHFVRLISEMKAAGQTIVLVTHDEDDIALLADRIFRLV